MLARIVGFICFIIGIYVLLVFSAPEFADRYGSTSLNNRLRTLKDASLQFATGAEDPRSLIDRIGQWTQSAFDDTKKKVDEVNKAVDTKIEQVKQVGTAVWEVYDSVKNTTDTVGNLVNTASTTYVIVTEPVPNATCTCDVPNDPNYGKKLLCSVPIEQRKYKCSISQ